MRLKNLFFRFYCVDLILDIIMFIWIIQWSVISLTLISLLHYLYYFFIDTLTVPKIRDLIHKPAERYQELSTVHVNSSPDMQDELKHFLDTISNKPKMTTPIEGYTTF